jgi:hypothetical protein
MPSPSPSGRRVCRPACDRRAAWAGRSGVSVCLACSRPGPQWRSGSERPRTRTTGVCPRRGQVRVVGGVIEKPASSSEHRQAPSAATAFPRETRSPSPRVTASSLRSRARRAGTWWLKPCRCSICAMAESAMLLWNRRPISVLIRVRPGLVRPAVRDRALGQRLLQYREQLLAEIGQRHRPHGPKTVRAGVPPGPTPPLNGAQAHP